MTGENLPCKRCGELMFGVDTYQLRHKCDACGGNKTKYNYKRPNPESALGRELAKEKNNG